MKENEISQSMGSTLNQLFENPVVQLISVLLLFAVLSFSKLGTTGLAVWDDGYYAQKAKEILLSGDWINIHYNGNPKFDNPPLFMWFQALSYKIWGINEYAAKFPSAVFGTLSILLLYLFGSELKDKNYGFLSALILALTQPFVRYSRRGMIDVTLTFFVLAALYFAWKGTAKDKRWFFLWALACGMSILLKSVLGGFPLIIVICWLILNKQREVLFSWEFILSIVLIFIIGGWWYLIEIIKWGQQFINLHFGWLIWARGFIRQEDSGHWWEHLSYLRDLLKYYWPWLPLAVLGLWYAFKNWFRGKDKSFNSLTLIWFLAYILVLSIMNARRIWYIMPVFPVLALFVAERLYVWIKSGKPYTDLAKGVFFLFLMSVGIINFFPLEIDKVRSLEVRQISPYVRYYAKREAKVLAYNLDYYGLNNALLFYSDCGATICRTETQIKGEILNGERVTCLVERGEYSKWTDGMKKTFKLVKQAGPLCYLTTGELLPDTLQIQSKPYIR